MRIVSRVPSEQARYESMIADGVSDSLAEVLATRRFPALRTDTAFMAGQWRQFEDTPEIGNEYRRRAELEGVSTNGKVYLRGLAAFPGDPRAWVDSRADVLKVAAERGWNVSGAVEYEAPAREKPPGPKVAPDLVAREVAEILDEDPSLDPAEVTEQVTKLRSGEIGTDTAMVRDGENAAMEALACAPTTT